MRLTAITPVRSEDWVFGLSLRALLMWCDSVVILNHASTDRTPAIVAEVAAEHPGRVTYMNESDPSWDEMRHRQRLLEAARQQRATHIAIIDADEVLTGNLVDVVRQYAETLRPGCIWELPGFNLRNGISQYHSNGTWGNRWFASIFVDEPRLSWTGDRFHHRAPMADPPLHALKLIPQDMGGIMHLWGASERRLRAKHFAYQLTERLRWPNKRAEEIKSLYSLAVNGDWRCPRDAWTFAPVPAEWWEPYSDLMEHLRLDEEPWQENYCRELVTSRPGIEVGCDSFGVI